MNALHEYSATDLVQMLRTSQCSRTELTQHYLDRIERANPLLRAFVYVDGDRAIERARAFDDAPDAVNETLLAGLPIADKDLVNRAGVPTSYGSQAMRGFVPDVSDGIVEVLDAHGANSLGKTNTPEFGFASYTENRLSGGAARNPWAAGEFDPAQPQQSLTHGPGGSSGGAAVAVAAGLLPVAPGSDGGGSVRIPAAACGLVGLKPSRGRIPDASGFELAGQLVVAGPLARTTSDAALLFDAMIAKNAQGQATYRYSQMPAATRSQPRSYLEAVQHPVARPLRIAVNTWTPWSEAFDCDCDPQALAVLQRTAQIAETNGHRVEAFVPPEFPGYAEAFKAVWRASAAALPLSEEQLQSVEPLTAWLVRSGRELPVAQLADALGRLAAFERFIIDQYAPYDLVLTPALAMSPRPLGWYDQHDGERNFVQQCQYTPYTSYVNVAGLPAITIPVARTPQPWGVQAIGRPGDERTLLEFAAQLEQTIELPAGHSHGWQLGDG